MGIFEEEYECMDCDQLHSLQEKRLKDIVKRCYKNSIFYKKSFDRANISPDDIKTLDDLKLLPFMSKMDFAENYPFGLFCCPISDVKRFHASSGTTSNPKIVGFTENDMKIWRNTSSRVLSAMGLKPGDKIQNAFYYGMFTGGFCFHDGAENLGLSIIPISAGNTERQVSFIQDLKSDILVCTPSYALYIGEIMKSKGILPEDISLSKGLFAGEPLTLETQKMINELFGIESFNDYGIAEIMPGLAFECSAHSGLHINEDHFIPEIINPDTGEVLPMGEEGELVFSCVTKEALPLLRYRTGDITSLSREKCSCGRTLVKMLPPRGRTDDMLIIRGVNVFPTQIEATLIEMGIAPNFKVIVNRDISMDTIEVQFEAPYENREHDIAYKNSIEARVNKKLKSRLGLEVITTMTPYKSIERVIGKSRRVIDNRGI